MDYKRQLIWFDDVIRTRSGKRKPYYTFSQVEGDNVCKDKEIRWFHEGYGLMKLYRIHVVDDENAIEEDVGATCFTRDPDWQAFSICPELALILMKGGFI